MDTRSRKKRPERLDGAPLDYAPENELGVVFLFADLAKKWDLRIERIHPSFPDCIAYKKADGQEKRIRIEFELKSKNFKNHGHSARKCDWIVCWEDNWPGAPASLKVVELCRKYGRVFSVWIQPVSDPYKEEISKLKSDTGWSVPPRASVGDLVLYYHTSPDKCIKDICRLAGPVRKEKADWRPGSDYVAHIRRVCHLRAPVFLEDLRNDRMLRTASFVRGKMRGRANATEFWPQLLDLIVRKNPSTDRLLKKYGLGA